MFRSPTIFTHASGYKAPLVRKLSGRRAKHRAPVITSVVGTSRNKQIQEEDEEEARAVSSRITRSRSTAGNFCRSLYARAASSQSTASLKNETWDEVATTSSVPNRAAASYKLAKHIQSVTGGISDDSGSDRRRQSLPIPSETTALNKPSLISDDTPRSKVAKHVQFTFKDNEISYEVTKGDIKNSWLDIDVSRAKEASENESHDIIVSFGPTGRFTASDTDACKHGKGYMRAD